MFKTNLFDRFLFLAVVVLMVAVVPNTQAQAKLSRCRTDPIFRLSNGDVINITLDIGTDESNIRNVSYVLNVPAGVTVAKVTYTAGGVGTKEMYKVYQDSPL